MEKFLILTCCAIFLALLFYTGMTLSSSPTRYVPPSYMEEYENWDPHGFQDYLHFCKYVYPQGAESLFKNSKNYRQMEKADVQTVQFYFEIVRKLLEYEPERLKAFDFPFASVNAGDCFRLDGDRSDFNIYFYDVETATLYFAHSNI